MVSFSDTWLELRDYHFVMHETAAAVIPSSFVFLMGGEEVEDEETLFEGDSVYLRATTMQ